MRSGRKLKPTLLKLPGELHHFALCPAAIISGIPFALAHEAADFFLGLLLVPAALLAIPKIGRRGT